MEAGPREDGVEKRVREMRAAEAEAIRAEETKHRELLAARDKLRDSFLAHLAQSTSSEVTLVEIEDAPYSLKALIHIEAKNKVWHRAIFVFGVDTYKDTDAGTDVTFFLSPSEPNDLPTPPGAERVQRVLSATLGAVVSAAVRVAIEIMARERYVGSTLITDAEAAAKERSQAASRQAKETTAKKPKKNGCGVALLWLFGLLMFAALVDAFNG